MKQKIIAGIIALGVILGTGSMTYAQTATSTVGSQVKVDQFIAALKNIRQLQLGMTGDDVKLLQQVLATQPDIYPEGIINGNFGPLTAKAIRKFQKKHGLPVVGRVGPMTLLKLQMIFGTTASGNATSSLLIWNVKTNDKKDHEDKDDEHKKPCSVTITTKFKHGDDDDKNTKITVPCGTGTGTTTPPTGTTTQQIPAPIISNLNSSVTSSTTARVSWTTDQFATAKIFFGTANPVLNASTTSTASLEGYILGHAFDLAHLTPNTTYNYVVSSVNFYGKGATSSQLSFTTLAQ
jgi:peptidoglycan hydrolase-like protein with peptidoglycan-binding domain